VHVVAQRLGHSKIEMTLNIYAHVLPDTYQPSPGQERRSSPSGRRVQKTRDRKQWRSNQRGPLQSRLRFQRWYDLDAEVAPNTYRGSSFAERSARVVRPSRPRNSFGPSYRPPHDERRRRRARPLSPGSGEG
jgi:hypothetical protein